MKFGLDENIIEKIIQVFEANSKVDKAFVFGSRAKGNYRPDSDIDIAVKGYDLTLDDIIKMNVAFEEKGINYKIDLIDYNSIKEKALVEHIDRVGIEIYSQWKEYMLGEIGEVITGNTPSSKFPEEFGHDTPFVTPTDYKNYNKWAISAERYLSNKGVLKLKSKLLSPYSLLITCIGSDMGKVVLNKVPVVTNQQINSIKPKINFDPEFLYYKLINCYDVLRTYGESGTAVPILNKSDFEKIKIEIPSLTKQKSIAYILSLLDGKIDLLHRQNKTLEQLTETVFRQWFVEEAEKSWVIGKINDIISVKGGTTPSTTFPEYWNGNIHWTTPRDLSNHYSVYLFNTERNISEAGLTKIGSGLLPKGTVLLSSRAPIGYLAITEIPVAINQGYIAILCNKKVSNYFMYLWCKANLEEIQNSGNGSVFEEISKTTFKDLDILIPPTIKLKEFDNLIEPTFQKIKANQIQIQTLTQLRDTLLPKLMSGEVRANLNKI